jgi:hypothetical protein
VCSVPLDRQSTVVHIPLADGRVVVACVGPCFEELKAYGLCKRAADPLPNRAAVLPTPLRVRLLRLVPGFRVEVGGSSSDPSRLDAAVRFLGVRLGVWRVR